MAKVFGGLIERARRVEARVTGTVEAASQRLAQSGARTPLEVAHAIVDVVESQAHVAGRGRRSFTAGDIRVTVLAPTRDARDQYEAVFDGALPLRDRILERLESLGCGNDDLAVDVAYAVQARPGWVAPDFHVVCHRAESSRGRLGAGEGAGPVIELRVTHGAAEQPAYFCSQAQVNIGRCRDVLDTRQRLVRTNHVVFVDSTDPANQSVSRQHAHIDCEGHDDVRLFDDGSAHGTSVVRSGRTIPVPPGSRGVRLRSGDGILLGQARLEVGLR